MKKIFPFIALILWAAQAIAQSPSNFSDYPNKAVKVVVSFPPGGTSDVLARMVAQELSKELKQPFIVENRAGAGGLIGTLYGSKAAPDGYTLIQTGVGQNAVAHGLEPKPTYDSLRDFIHISQINSGPNVLVVNADTPFKTFKELIDYGKANPGKLSYGFTYAASGHMAMELLKQTVSSICPTNQKCKPLFMVGISYRGGGPLITDVLGGQIPLTFINQDTALPFIKSGKLRALAVTTLQRNPLYPNVPTISELGYPNFTATSWSGISVPKGTPKPIVDKLEAAITKIMHSSAMKQRMDTLGFVIPEQGSVAYTAFVQSEIDKWTRVIKTAGIKSE